MTITNFFHCQICNLQLCAAVNTAEYNTQFGKQSSDLLQFNLRLDFIDLTVLAPENQ